MLIFLSLNAHALNFHTLCSWFDTLALWPFPPLFTLCHGKRRRENENKREEDTETEIKRKERREGWREREGRRGLRWSAGHSITGWTSAQGAEGEPHYSATVYSLSVLSLACTHTHNTLWLINNSFTIIIWPQNSSIHQAEWSTIKKMQCRKSECTKGILFYILYKCVILNNTIQ